MGILFFLAVIMLVIYENVPFVLLSLLSYEFINKLLVLHFHIYYKNRIVKLFRLVVLLKNNLSYFCKKYTKKVYLCSSTLLTTRLDILEAVTKNIGSSRNLRKEAEKNAESSGESVHNEVINLTDAKVRALELAHKEFSEQATHERKTTSNTSNINSYAEDADAMYLSA
jgi:hypothetical protein